MCTYMGNVGHLMQHWTLCEVLTAANKCTSGLNYIDAHAMAPWATEPMNLDARFINCRNVLPGQESVYERAWLALAGQQQGAGYPSSAAFVRQVWQGKYSLLLCENNPTTINAINHWLPGTRQQPNCTCAKLFPGNWRDRFEQGLPSPAAVGLPEKSLTLVSFDPNSCGANTPQRTPPPDNPNVYPDDLRRALTGLSGIKGGILIQLCAYKSHRYNAQEDVIYSFDRILTHGEFQRVAVVRPLTTKGQPHRSMMSLVYARGVTWADKLADLPDCFEKWLRT